MLPADYVTAWVRVGPRFAPISYRPTACKLWWRTTIGNFATWTLHDKTVFAELFTIYLQDIFQTAMSSDFTSSQVRVNLFYGGGSFEVIVPFARTGAGPSDLPSPALSCCILKRTSKPGRSGLGRMFMSGIPYAWLDGNLINGAGMVAYRNFATAMSQDYITTFAPYGPVVLSPRLYSLQDDDLTVIDDWVCREVPTYLYRRRIRQS